jgi:hypothetical protein
VTLRDGVAALRVAVAIHSSMATKAVVSV